CREREPMTSNGSPYSSNEQSDDIATAVPPDVQLSEPAWCTPMLWPSSCANTRVETSPFSQIWRPGISARPDQPHADWWGKGWATEWWAPGLMPAGGAARRAAGAHASTLQRPRFAGSVYQP